MENSTGLKRSLSPLNVWSLAFGCIIGWGAFVMPGNMFLVKSGPLGTAIAMLLATVIMVIIAVNYSYMINLYPVAGGEFTYTSSCFGKGNGFVCAWFLCLSYLSIVPLNATALALISRNLLSDIFAFGFHYQVAGYDIYLGELLLALFALVIFGVLNIRGVKSVGKFQTVLVIMLVSGVLIICAAALVSDKASWSNLSPGFVPGQKPLKCIAATVAVAPWAFVGFDTVPQATEEMKFSKSKTNLIIILSILFGAFVYVSLCLVTASVLPEGYGSWPEYIADVPALSGLISLPTFNAAYELLGSVGLIFIGLAVLAAILSGIIGFYMAASRLLYSMAEKAVIPTWFGKLHPKYATPVNSIVFVMLASMLAPFFGRTVLNWIVDMTSIGAAIGFGYTSAAAFVSARDSACSSVMITGALGTLFSVAFILLLLIPIPALGCSLSKQSLISLAVWSVLGLIFYLSVGRK